MNSEQQRLSEAQILHLQREEEFNKKMKEAEEGLRATGRTTRLVDRYVQELFHHGEVILRDHHEGGSSAAANEYLANKFEDRMAREHEEIVVKYNNAGSITTARIIKD